MVAILNAGAGVVKIDHYGGSIFTAGPTLLEPRAAAAAVLLIQQL